MSIDSISPAELRDIASRNSRISSAQVKDDKVFCTFIDKDGDPAYVWIDPISSSRLTMRCAPVRVADHLSMIAMVVSNDWNGRLDTHGTLSWLEPDEEGVVWMMLSSDLMLEGGVNKSNVASWIESYVKHLDPYIEASLRELRELDADSQSAPEDHQRISVSSRFQKLMEKVGTHAAHEVTKWLGSALR
ncbi:hypothetical protein [Streptomyces sp. HUAS TT20]|uniref:hypothetical protein n=1 Tax=Streptomyces sp. HUAS TT20 TaxID=3447509 RepID=UPI0021D82D33|nr:hypothetical protein [Streptomyces sp. HUAS 15-9]UXY32398.1 hypothetical protein N8I87_41865 [Streptomyces sp. HUAS 15-9]